MAKILVLCVDRDDDLGEKAEITGPIIGRESNLKAAEELGLADASDSDTNAIFKAVSTYEDNADAVDVVTITGDRKRGYDADKEIASQLDDVLRKYEDINGVYLITDGSQDDQIIPIIQSRTKIVSKENLIVEQSEQIERSYYVIKEALKDPTFARIIFGLPGIIILMVAVFQELGIKIVLLGIGAYLVLKGFGIEEKILESLRAFRDSTSLSRATFPLYIGAILTFMLSVWGGLEKFAEYTDALLITQAAGFLSGFINLFMISGILFLIGRIGDRHSNRNVLKMRKHILTLVSLLSIWLVILWGVEAILGSITLNQFFLYTMFIFLATLVALALVRRIYMMKYVYPKITANKEVFDTKGRKIGSVISLNEDAGYIIIYDERENQRVNRPISTVVIAREYLSVSPF